MKLGGGQLVRSQRVRSGAALGGSIEPRRRCSRCRRRRDPAATATSTTIHISIDLFEDCPASCWCRGWSYVGRWNSAPRRGGERWFRSSASRPTSRRRPCLLRAVTAAGPPLTEFMETAARAAPSGTGGGGHTDRADAVQRGFLGLVPSPRTTSPARTSSSRPAAGTPARGRRGSSAAWFLATAPPRRRRPGCEDGGTSGTVARPGAPRAHLLSRSAPPGGRARVPADLPCGPLGAGHLKRLSTSPP